MTKNHELRSPRLLLNKVKSWINTLSYRIYIFSNFLKFKACSPKSTFIISKLMTCILKKKELLGYSTCHRK
ncbi:hypothetical protein Glove_209g13 [Diversispora epigaea]|uniref:Uncharacterized protein n=1 Tax=Diversispora epigaea TaxID=1348612 RepID=A0A397IS92_9GLOM|nr:hypothetical protein Glove_209g13 [Diversispora epigaea]